MRDLQVSRAAASDQPQLHQIWQNVFGDSDELILAFFDCFPPETAAWTVRHGETILSAAYLIPGNWYLNNAELCPVGYVYAVATAPEHRGKGYAGTLMRAISSEAKERKMMLYTRPAEPSLYPWYAETMSAVHTGRMSEQIVCRSEKANTLSCKRLSPEEYGALREIQLQQTPHIVLSDRFLKLQEVYSDGFYAVGEGVCCCTVQGEALLISEYIGRIEDCCSAAQVMMNLFGKKSAVVRLEQTEGALPSVAYCGERRSGDTHWGLFLE